MDPQTIKTYDEMAAAYDEETKDFWERFPRTIIDKFIESVKGKILDVGSGPGRDGLILKDRGLDVICLDASEEMVKLSSQKGLISIVGDILSLPFSDESFDGVWAYTSLLHIKKAEIKTALREVSRVVKSGGFLGLGLIEGDTEEYRESSGVGKPRLFAFYRKEELEEILKEVGFRIVYFEQFKPNSKNYLNFICQKIGS
ncbi:MAG TPA: class I SAM-dependent methyltransferase [Candidatus Paceibacterota bacterium]|nr:class I SAM-dependent methyltransferase [Candidatus Paceibacterota bacterium]